VCANGLHHVWVAEHDSAPAQGRTCEWVVDELQDREGLDRDSNLACNILLPAREESSRALRARRAVAAAVTTRRPLAQTAGANPSRGAASTSQPFSLWQALFAPSDISRATQQQQQGDASLLTTCGHPCGGGAGGGGGGRGGCYIHVPPADVMDVVLLPLALVPGTLGATTRARIALALAHLLRYSLACARVCARLMLKGHCVCSDSCTSRAPLPSVSSLFAVRRRCQLLLTWLNPLLPASASIQRQVQNASSEAHRQLREAWHDPEAAAMLASALRLRSIRAGPAVTEAVAWVCLLHVASCCVDTVEQLALAE